MVMIKEEVLSQQKPNRLMKCWSEMKKLVNSIYRCPPQYSLKERKTCLKYLWFPERPNNSGDSWLKSSNQCNHSNWIGQNRTKSTHQYLQNQRNSIFSNTGTKWLVRKTFSNSHTQIGYWRQYFGRSFCRNEEVDKTIYRNTLQT